VRIYSSLAEGERNTNLNRVTKLADGSVSGDPTYRPIGLPESFSPGTQDVAHPHFLAHNPAHSHDEGNSDLTRLHACTDLFSRWYTPDAPGIAPFDRPLSREL
jgi:hypothetical protein